MPRTAVVIAVLAPLLSSRSSFADDMSTELSPDLAGPDPGMCSQDGSVIGYGCPPYGMWGAALEAPYVVVGMGFNVRRLPRDPAAAQLARTTTGGSTIAPLDSDTSYTISETMAIAMSSVAYFGLECEVSPSAPETLAPGQRSMAAGIALLLGLHGGSSSLTLGVELAGGLRVVDSQDVFNGDEGVLEARVHGDLWVTPWFTIGALVGASLLDRGDLVTGVQLGFHSWSYGGN